MEEEADQWLGCAMTYTIFECLKEKLTDLLEEQTLVVTTELTDDVSKIAIDNTQVTLKTIMQNEHSLF